MKAVLLAIVLAGCATIPEGAVLMTVDDLARIEANYMRLTAEIMRLRASKVPLCRETGREWLLVDN